MFAISKIFCLKMSIYEICILFFGSYYFITVMEGCSMKEISIESPKKKASIGARIVEELRRNYVLYLMAIPVIAYFVIFAYLPMFGLIIAFKNYVPVRGIFGSEWADMYGFYHFYNFLTSPLFLSVVKNTITINLSVLVFEFPTPIIFALMLNEIRNLKYKKVIQTVTYLPHFISMVVICGMVTRFFRSDGILTSLIVMFGGERTNYMLEPAWFRPIYIFTGMWQQLGWNSIIYVSALSSIDQELYEAAVIDGAGKWKQTIHITIPGIASTIIILLIMRIGRLLSVGYEKILLLQTDQTANVARVISSYVYEIGLGATIPVPNSLSLSSAVGIFSSLINILLLFVANTVSRKFSESSLF